MKIEYLVFSTATAHSFDYLLRAEKEQMFKKVRESWHELRVTEIADAHVQCGTRLVAARVVDEQCGQAVAGNGMRAVFAVVKLWLADGRGWARGRCHGVRVAVVVADVVAV